MSTPTTVDVVLDGAPAEVPAAMSVAAALAARGHLVLRRSPVNDEPRAVFCGMGACQECAVTIDGRPGERACITPVASGMRIETGTAASAGEVR